jgi:glycosyltransferase involved in cell wall biosynthesis
VNCRGIPLISVIVTTRNWERTLRACLDSIRKQTHKWVELIGVDIASNEQTIQIGRGYTNIVKNACSEKSAQRNRGAQTIAGQFLLILDAGAIAEPQVIEECANIASLGNVPAVVITEPTGGPGFWSRWRALERSCYSRDDLVEAACYRIWSSVTRWASLESRRPRNTVGAAAQPRPWNGSSK